MSANYDKIANVYDFVSRIIFRNSLVDAQTCLLKYVPSNSRILIVGGGTGWILESFANKHPQGLIIDYVESSAQMIALSKKRNCKTNTINFINLPVENYSTQERYDIILTPFLFDNFTEDKIRLIFTQLHSLLKINAIWLYADFVYNKKSGHLWQRLLLKLMYLFFRITTRIETNKLVSMDPFFNRSYQLQFEAAHFFNFIKSRVYKKCAVD